MTKKIVLATLLLSSVALAQAVSADEVQPSDAVAVVPDTSLPSTSDSSSSLPSAAPTSPSTSPEISDTTSSSDASSGVTDGTTLPPASTDTTTSEQPSVPEASESESPSDNESVPETNPVEPDSQKTPETTPSTGEVVDASPVVEVPTTSGEVVAIPSGTDTPTNNPNISAEVAKAAGASQVGTTSTVTGQVVRNVTSNNPVSLSSGAVITDIRDGLVTLNTGQKVAPESVGLKQNSDGTFTATTSEGEQVTLPHTGEKENLALALLGLVTTLTGIGVAFADRLGLKMGDRFRKLNQ